MADQPAKKRARVDDPRAQQSKQIKQLFSNPDREIKVDKPVARTIAAPPEVVANVQGSSAGAGSGEFHVYKASRRREMERLALMDEENKRETEADDWERQKEKMMKLDEERTAKKRAKRQKRKGVKEDTAAESEEQKGDRNAGKLRPVRLLQTNCTVKAGLDDAGGANAQAESKDEIGIVIHDDD